MRENGAEVATGAIVLAAAVGFVIFTLQLTGFGAGSRSYDLSASFRSIEGIDVGTEVRLAGVKIGNVSDISLNSETFRGDATLTISRGAEIPNDSSAVVASEGILGGNFVEIVPGGSFDVYAPGDEILDTQGAVSLIFLLLKFVSGEGDR